MFFHVRALNRLVGLLAHHGEAPPAEERASREEFLQAMARAVNGVAVLTTDGPGGAAGLTVSSVTSVSADPPLLLVCIRQDGLTAAAIRKNRRFCVNLLGPQHRDLAQRFAGREGVESDKSFAGPPWRQREARPPTLVDAVASFDCVLVRTLRAGTHRIFLGRCAAARTGSGPALLYSARGYGVPHLESESGSGPLAVAPAPNSKENDS